MRSRVGKILAIGVDGACSTQFSDSTDPEWVYINGRKPNVGDLAVQCVFKAKKGKPIVLYSVLEEKGL